MALGRINGVNGDIARSMKRVAVAHIKRHVMDLALGIAEIQQIAGFGIIQGVSFELGELMLLPRIAREGLAMQREHGLDKAAAIDAGVGASTPQIRRALEIQCGVEQGMLENRMSWCHSLPSATRKFNA